MEKITTKIESVVEKWIADFENKPIKTGIKIYVVYWIIKQLYKNLK